MRTNSPRATTFRVDQPHTKCEQERIVSDAFISAYYEQMGVQLLGNEPVRREPPDRMCTWRNHVVGLELFELEQFYETRAFEELLVNEVYAELERHGRSKLFDGLHAQLICSHALHTAQDVRAAWKRLGIARAPARVFATEFVHLFRSLVDQTEMMPDTPIGVFVQIDRKRYPAMSVLGDGFHISKGPLEDSRRSDGKAAPLVSVGGSYVLSESSMKQSIERQIASKIDDRSKWMPCNHSILIAHDLPRDRPYHAFGRRWSEWLMEVASRVNISVFDEIWLVTYQRLSPESIRIAGQSLIT